MLDELKIRLRRLWAAWKGDVVPVSRLVLCQQRCEELEETSRKLRGDLKKAASRVGALESQAADTKLLTDERDELAGQLARSKEKALEWKTNHENLKESNEQYAKSLFTVACQLGYSPPEGEPAYNEELDEALSAMTG